MSAVCRSQLCSFLSLTAESAPPLQAGPYGGAGEARAARRGGTAASQRSPCASGCSSAPDGLLCAGRSFTTRRLWRAPQVAPEGHASTKTAGPPLHVMIAGAPAAGKGTQCQRIVQKVLPEVAVSRPVEKQESWPGRVSHWRQAAMLPVCFCLAPGPCTAALRLFLPLQGCLSACCVGAAPAPDEAASGMAPVVLGCAAPHSAPKSAWGGANSARSSGAPLRGCSLARCRRRRARDHHQAGAP